MAYAVTMTSPASRMLKKLPVDVRRHIIKETQTIVPNPQLGEQLQGELKYLRSLHTVFRGTHYRVIYEVNNHLQQIIVRAVGPRENLYVKLRHMKLKPLTHKPKRQIPRFGR